MSFIDNLVRSKVYKTFMGYLYGWGAAVVIIGALFKIMHWPGANAMLIAGIMTKLALQVFFNIGVVTNLLPATGIALPFFSYGGTALMLNLFEMGMVLQVSRQNNNKLL